MQPQVPNTGGGLLVRCTKTGGAALGSASLGAEALGGGGGCGLQPCILPRGRIKGDNGEGRAGT